MGPRGPFVEVLFGLMCLSILFLLGDHRVTSDLTELGVQGILGEAWGTPLAPPPLSGRAASAPGCCP